MHPASPSEVVELAGRHLGLDRSFVVARAKDLEPDQERRREPAQLRALWMDLVAGSTTGMAEPSSEAGGGSTPDVPQDRALPADPVPGRGSAAEAAASERPVGSDSGAERPVGADSGAELSAGPNPADGSHERPTGEDPATPPHPTENPAGVHAYDDEYADIDLESLDDAPSHAHDIEQKIKAAFPGAQLVTLPEPDGGDSDGHG